MTTAFEARFGDDFLDFIKECAESAISDHDFSSEVESCWEDIDINDAIRDAVSDSVDINDLMSEWQGSRGYDRMVQDIRDESGVTDVEAEVTALTTQVTALKVQVATLVTMLGTWASDNGYTKPVVTDDTQGELF